PSSSSSRPRAPDYAARSNARAKRRSPVRRGCSFAASCFALSSSRGTRWAVVLNGSARSLPPPSGSAATPLPPASATIHPPPAALRANLRAGGVGQASERREPLGRLGVADRREAKQHGLLRRPAHHGNPVPPEDLPARAVELSLTRPHHRL